MYTDDTVNSRAHMSDELLCRMLDGNAPQPMRTSGENCAEGRKSWGLEGFPLTSVYAPLQSFHKLYDKDAALVNGTLFAELYLPFMGESIGTNGGGCRG
jgi:hypothetical protein